MFVFGHVGLTWGGTVALFAITHRLLPSGSPPGVSTRDAGAVVRRSLGADVDFRFAILGSMLPDLIDKPLGIFILGDELSNGRIFGHSLAFVLLLLLAALALRRSAGRALSLVALGSAAHLVLDRLWKDSNALLWPLLGWSPEKQDVSGWLGQMLEQLSSDPYTYVSEAVGAAIVVALLAYLLMRRGLKQFVLTGRMARRPQVPPVSG